MNPRHKKKMPEVTYSRARVDTLASFVGRENYTEFPSENKELARKKALHLAKKLSATHIATYEQDPDPRGTSAWLYYVVGFDSQHFQPKLTLKQFNPMYSVMNSK